LAELAETLRLVLANLRWDYEEDLAARFGDIPAHRIAALINTLAGWQRDAARNVRENVAEYLVFDQQALARPAELAAYSAAVEELHGEAALLEQRVERLATALKPAT
jgi:ubiquinone biosynthesis protein UbiJ